MQSTKLKRTFSYLKFEAVFFSKLQLVQSHLIKRKINKSEELKVYDNFLHFNICQLKQNLLQFCLQVQTFLLYNLKISSSNTTSMIGIIIPPGQIKKLVQKTAQHVAVNGSQFQKMILQRQLHNAQFAFLQKDNPYRAYYDHMVAEISRKLLQQAEIRDNPQIIQTKLEENEQKQVQLVKLEEPQNQQAQFLERVFQQIKEPQPDRFTAPEPQKITQAEIAIIQHTAQYVAKIGKDFLIALSERQKSNPQFQFLKKSSNNYEYFVKMYEAYQNLLNLSEKDISALQEMKNKKEVIFNKCQQVYQYHAAKQKQMKGKDQQTDDSKKQSNIDWNDYQIVETIVFEGMDKKNKNLTMNINGQQRELVQAPFKGMEEKIISAPKKKQILQQCHVCRNNILASQMTKHLKTCLGQKKRPAPVDSNFQKGNDEVDIRKNLQSLSTKRPDIFGGDGAKISRQQNDNDNTDKIIWDGQAPNMSRATASIAMVNNQQKKINQQSRTN